MRILIVCQYYYPENVVIAPIAEELAKRGHEVSVVTGLPNYGYPDILPGYKKIRFETINHVKVYRVKLHARKTGTLNLILNYLSFWKNSTHFLKHFKEEYDLVYSMCLSPITAVAGANVYAKKHNVPHILHCLDLWPESPVATGAIKRDSLAYKYLFRLSRSIYSKISRVLISSPSFEDYLRNVIGLQNKDIRFVPQPPLVVDSKSSPIAYDGKINIVYAGNIGTLQMVEEFVVAISKLPSSFDAQFHIIGSGQRLNEVLSLIKKHSLEKRVVYHGLVPSEEIGRYLEGADLIFMGLKFESDSAVSRTIPNKVISDLYFGKPIVASISGDGEEVLKKADGSFFAEGGKPEDIEKALELALNANPLELKKMGENNKTYFDKHFSFSKVMDQLEEEFKDIKKA